MTRTSLPQVVSSRSFVAGVLTRLQGEQQRWYKQLQDLAEKLPETERLVLTPPAPRSASTRLRVVVLGPTKAGKSTLLNALLGRYALPTKEGRETTRAVSIVHRQELSTPELWRSDEQLLATGEDQIAAWLHQANANDRRRAESKIEGSAEQYHLELHARLPGFLTPAAANSDGVATEFIDIPGYGETDPYIKAITATQVSQADMILLVFKPEQLDSKDAAETTKWLSDQREDLQGKVAMITCVINFQLPTDEKARKESFDKARKLLSGVLTEGDKIPILSVKADFALFARLQSTKETIPESLNFPLQAYFRLLPNINLEATWLPKLEEYIIDTIYSHSGLRLLQSQISRIRKEIEKNESEVSGWIGKLRNKHKKIIGKIKEIEHQKEDANTFLHDSKPFRAILEKKLVQDLDATISKLEVLYNAPELNPVLYYWEDDAQIAHVQRKEYLTKHAIPLILDWERRVCDVAARSTRQNFGFTVTPAINTITDSYLGTAPKNRIALGWKIATIGIAHLFDYYDLEKIDIKPRITLKQRQGQILDAVFANIKKECAKKSYSNLIAKFQAHGDRINEYILRAPATCPASNQLDELDFLIVQAQTFQIRREKEDDPFTRNASERYEHVKAWAASTQSQTPENDVGPRRSAIADMRKKLKKHLITDTDFDAFCLDYYTGIHSRFTNGMDREQKVNLLLSMNVREEQLAEMERTLEARGQSGTKRAQRPSQADPQRSIATAVPNQASGSAGAPIETSAPSETKPAGIHAPRSVEAVKEGEHEVAELSERPPRLIPRPFYRQPQFWIVVIVVLLLLLIFGVASTAIAHPAGKPRQHDFQAANILAVGDSRKGNV